MNMYQINDVEQLELLVVKEGEKRVVAFKKSIQTEISQISPDGFLYFAQSKYVTYFCIFSELQGNRNPFIDHPEWVTAIWKKEGSSYEKLAS